MPPNMINASPTAIPALAGRPLDLCPGERWYAVHSQPASEIRASTQLENQGFRTFMPKRRKTVRHARQTRNVVAALFPRYLFVALDLSRDSWRCVNGTYGVSRLVMRGEEPNPVPRGIVEGLIAATDSEGFLSLSEKLRPGNPVRLMAGPFADHLAILEHLDDAGRVRVLLDLMGRQVRLETQANNVLPIASPAAA